MRVIFLDIDGPLAPRGREDPFVLDTKCCSNLRRLVDETDAQVILSSSWPEEEATDVLGSHGIHLSGYLGEKRRGHVDRVYEIVSWLQTHPEIVSWISIDDDPQEAIVTRWPKVKDDPVLQIIRDNLSRLINVDWCTQNEFHASYGSGFDDNAFVLAKQVLMS